MTRELLLICIILFVIPMGMKLVYGQSVGGEVNATNPHFENTFQQRLGSNYTANLIIIYQSPMMVVLKGDLVLASPGTLCSKRTTIMYSGKVLKYYGRNLDSI